MTALDGPAGRASVARPGTGLAALFETLDGERRLAHVTTRARGPELCTWCGETSEPGPLCSECGSPMLTAV